MEPITKQTGLKDENITNTHQHQSKDVPKKNQIFFVNPKEITKAFSFQSGYSSYQINNQPKELQLHLKFVRITILIYHTKTVKYLKIPKTHPA
jgi:hypothetical protein